MSGACMLERGLAFSEEIMRRFDGKRVIVTGGANGIGKATVARFATEGATVVITDIDGAAGETTARQIAGQTGATIYPFRADVSVKADDQAAVEFALEKMGGVDILVNNAGIYYEDHFEEITEERWDAIMNVDLKGTFLMTQALVPYYKEIRSGIIVNMASTNGLAGEIYYSHYNAAKAGIVLLTKTLAIELGPFGIRVNCVCPGYIVTESTVAMDSEEFVNNYIQNKIPLRRTGKPEEVASVITFLASEDASFVHGDAILIDGGQLAD
jgi:NAD(P)-dependent dehydrogenase (short-subunit alcohol dehydrogenase family)